MTGGLKIYFTSFCPELAYSQQTSCTASPENEVTLSKEQNHQGDAHLELSVFVALGTVRVPGFWDIHHLYLCSTMRIKIL